MKFVFQKFVFQECVFQEFVFLGVCLSGVCLSGFVNVKSLSNDFQKNCEIYFSLEIVCTFVP